MPFSLTATVYPNLPGAVRLGVVGDAGVASSIVRQDAAYEGQPVRNYSTTGSGIETVIDCEAPLGRPVSYSLLDPAGKVLASAGPVTCPALPNGRGILRSVLRPQVSWMEVDPQDVTGTEWESSTTVHRIVGSDTPVVVGEIRQRRSETITFLCRSVAEADRLVGMCGDGSLLLLRLDPCASVQTRDALMYPLGITERRWGRQGWRLVSIEAQTSKFVPGDTEEPPFDFDFAALATRAETFAGLTEVYSNFAAMALDVRRDGGAE